MEAWRKDLYLAHHGVLGQKWGIRHEKSSSGTKRSQTSKSKIEDKKNHKGLSDKQKKYIKRGAIIAGVAVAAIGTAYLYKSGKLNPLINEGKNITNKLLKKKMSGDVFKQMKPESVKSALANANKLKGTKEGANTCVPSVLAGFMRMHGLDVSVKSTGGVAQSAGGVIEECFKNAKVYDGSAIEFGKSPQNAARMLVKHFGPNAEGICAIDWKNSKDGVGHAFYWKTNGNKVSFLDFKTGSDNILHYWNNIDTNGSLTLAKMEIGDLIESAASKYVK